MQNDYRILYEIIKERTENLEICWKKILNQVKASNSQEINSKANFANIESISHVEVSRPSFGRRINPTQLKSELTNLETNIRANPFSTTSINNEIDSKRFEMNINRPIGKNVNENAWKKLSTPTVTKIEIDSYGHSKVKMEYALYFKQGISIDQQNILKKLAAAYSQIVFDEVFVDFSSFTENFGIILRILAVGHELFSLNIYSKIVIDQFLLKPLPKSFGFNGEDLNILEGPIELFLFTVFWIQGVREILVQLLPDSVRCFEKNLLIDSIDPNLVSYFKNNFKKEESSPGSKNGLSLHSLLPVAYSNQRDSKNFFKDSALHTNQQKIRDLFINLVRHFSINQLDTSHPNFHRSFSSRVSELISKMNAENYIWLADLYIQEYEQTADVRLDRLEERLASRRPTGGNNSTTFSLDQIFFMFLQYADSYRLTRAVEKKIIAMISVSLEQANNPHKRSMWPECIRKLRSIIKLLAFCRYKMIELSGLEDDKNSSIIVEEEDVIIFSWTQEAILNRQLLTFLPLIYEYFSFIGENSIKTRCSNTVKLLMRYYQVKFELKNKKSPNKTTNSGVRARLFLRLCLEDIFRETLNSEFYAECVMSLKIINQDADSTAQTGNIEEEDDEKRISKSRKSENNGVLARALDEDDVLPASVSSVYRSISSQVRNIYLQLNSICMPVGLNNIYGGSDGFSLNTSTNSGSANQLQNSEAALRKVRPITQVPAADLKQQKIQKQLRQWFWWRYGSQKDLIDGLNSYILEQLLYPQFSMDSDRRQSAEICKQMHRDLICKILPDLLPNFWKERSELIEMIIGLGLEIAGKSINHHFLE